MVSDLWPDCIIGMKALSAEKIAPIVVRPLVDMIQPPLAGWRRTKQNSIPMTGQVCDKPRTVFGPQMFRCLKTRNQVELTAQIKVCIQISWAECIPRNSKLRLIDIITVHSLDLCNTGIKPCPKPVSLRAADIQDGADIR